MLVDGEILPDLTDEILAACCVTSTSDQLTEAR
jgi:NAD(P) transhydrogenase subunit alpha